MVGVSIEEGGELAVGAVTTSPYPEILSNPLPDPGSLALLHPSGMLVQFGKKLR